MFANGGKALAGVLAAVTMFVAGCSPSGARQGQTVPDAPIQRPPVAVTDRTMAARGQIVRVYPDQPFDRQLEASAGTAVRAVYRSTSGVTGASSLVAGFFAVPKGTPPKGGWPIVSFAHGTTGVEPGCGPSQRPDLMGDDETIRSVLNGGYAVAMTDYQGLDDLGLHPLQEPGPHPFLEPYTAAYNVIDAVRALRQLFPDISTRWSAVGGSQGGQAAWAANEFNGQYGQGLNLVGAVALAPAVNLTPLAGLSRNRRLTDSQRGVMPLVIAGLQRAGLLRDQDAFLRGDALSNEKFILGCAQGAAQARSTVRSEDLGPATGDTEAELRRALQAIALPQHPLSAPLLVVNGKRDDTIPPAWVTFAVEASCKAGGSVQHLELDDAGHDIKLSGDVPRWLRQRFDGKPVESDCPA